MGRQMKPIAILVPLGLLLSVPAAAAQDPPPADASLPTPSTEQAMLLRCSAAFAIVAGDQARGLPVATAYPPLGTRGKEFFVRASAQLMDDLHISREQVQAMMQQQVDQLQRGSNHAKDHAAYVDQVMQPCLEVLEASGL